MAEAKTNNYFSFLTEGLAQLLSGVLSEHSKNPFRRSPQVRLGLPSNFGTDDYYIVLTGKKQLDTEKGSFNCPIDDNRFLVFRSPVRVCSSFLVYAESGSTQLKLGAFDKLSTYFFDNKSIEPIIPNSYREFPALYKRLSSQRAELRINEKDSGQLPITVNGRPQDTFQFRFDYISLYHSGNPLREDRKVKQRVIDYENEQRERSML